MELVHLSPEEFEEIVELAREAREAQEDLLAGGDDEEDDDEELLEELDDDDEPASVTAEAPEVDALRERVAALAPDARAELLAVAYVGRGDFTAEEWDDAVLEAQAVEEAGQGEAALDTWRLVEQLDKAAAELGLADQI